MSDETENPILPDYLNVDDKETIANRSQERIREVYREYGFKGEPNVSPGLVGIVFQELDAMLSEREGVE